MRHVIVTSIVDAVFAFAFALLYTSLLLNEYSYHDKTIAFSFIFLFLVRMENLSSSIREINSRLKNKNEED